MATETRIVCCAAVGRQVMKVPPTVYVLADRNVTTPLGVVMVIVASG